MPDMQNAAVIYDKYVNGDPLTDYELGFGISHYKLLADFASKSGPVFKLAANEARRVADGLEQFANARKSR